MLLFGCLLAFTAALFPRLVLIAAWLFSERWDVVWGDWFGPLLGIIFVPYTTIFYMLVWSPAGIQGFDWAWLGLGLLLDLMKWGQIINNRTGVPGYPKGEKAPAAVAPPPEPVSSSPLPEHAAATQPPAEPAAAPPAADPEIPPSMAEPGGEPPDESYVEPSVEPGVESAPEPEGDPLAESDNSSPGDTTP